MVVRNEERTRDVVRARLREVRRRRGLTQEKLCELARVSVDAITRIERGARQPSLDTLDRLARALRTTVADLVRAGPMPMPMHPPAVQRLLACLEQEPARTQRAAEVIVKALVQAVRPERTSRAQPRRDDR